MSLSSYESTDVLPKSRLRFLHLGEKPWLTHQPSKIVLVSQKGLDHLIQPWLERGVCLHIALPSEEKEAKSWNTVCQVIDRILTNGCDRQAEIWALGGGVVGDVAGFIASILLRGVRLIHIPTTLLAQIDSSIGGKTAINTEQGKNLVGTFYPASEIWLDAHYLSGLPGHVYQMGLGEVLKYAILDQDVWDMLYTHGDQIHQIQHPKTLDILYACSKVKERIVSMDPFETGQERLKLNLGHSFAHAIEHHTHYQWSHGQAVGVGVCLAVWAAQRLDLCSKEFYQDSLKLAKVLGCLSREWPYPYLSTQNWQNLMKRDKKNTSGKIRWILPRGVGDLTLQEMPPLHFLWDELANLRYTELNQYFKHNPTGTPTRQQENRT